MSRWFRMNPETKTVHDIVWRKTYPEPHPEGHEYLSRWWTVWWGETRMGDVIGPDNGWKGWIAIAHAQDLIGPRMIDGFHSRLYATDYIFNISGFNKENNSERAEWENK